MKHLSRQGRNLYGGSGRPSSPSDLNPLAGGRGRESGHSDLLSGLEGLRGSRGSTLHLLGLDWMIVRDDGSTLPYSIGTGPEPYDEEVETGERCRVRKRRKICP